MQELERVRSELLTLRERAGMCTQLHPWLSPSHLCFLASAAGIYDIELG